MVVSGPLCVVDHAVPIRLDRLWPYRAKMHPPHSKAQRARPVLHQEELCALADAVDADSHCGRPQLRWTRVQWFSRMRSAAFSPTITAGAWVLPWGMTGKTEASATRSPSTPY